MKKNFINNFFICGLCGWCMECFWTGLGSFKKWKSNDRTLSCHTSIWMFPIYGLAACLSPICTKLQKRNALLRGGVYAFLIYTIEYTTGVILKKYRACPWDYSKSKFNIKGVIRFDYAPAWFLTGLIFEKILDR
ncbi:MAG: hypothetical protein GX319_09365 [Clostridiales bacterium]|nr:hypothetical protein [Bacillota bacterium]NLK04596.1 hypothetical protein [Clostridiales bacterium]